jgi:hypothetical protein
MKNLTKPATPRFLLDTATVEPKNKFVKNQEEREAVQMVLSAIRAWEYAS